jgi:hypothetical protein
VVAITRHQEQMLNIAHQTWIGTVQENDSLLTVLDSCHIGFLSADSAIHSLQSIIQADNIYIAKQATVVDTLLVVIKEQKKTIRKLQTKKALSELFSGALVVVIGYLLLR